MSELGFTPVAAVLAVEPGALVRAEVGGRVVLIAHVDGTFYCVANRCTHAAWAMDTGPLEGTELVCGLHGGRFDVRTGAATGRPATKPLDVYPVRVVDGQVCVQVPPR